MLENPKMRMLLTFTMVSFLGATLFLHPNVSFGSTSQSSAGLTGMIIPLYGYPGSDWSVVAQAKSANPSVPMIVVVNPSDGPGWSIDPNFVSGIEMLQSAGVVVLGYVPTYYGGMPSSTAMSEIQDYSSMYHVNGIFFDQMSNIPGYEWYYSSLSNYAKSIGLWFTVGNAGAQVPESYIGTVDNIVVYENYGLPTLSSLAWLVGGYPKSDFSILPYGVSWLDTSYIWSSSSYVSYLYVTDGTLPTPYTSLCSYFESLVSTLAAIDYSAQPVTVEALDMSGNPIQGLWTSVQSSGSNVGSGFTPYKFYGSPNAQYQVSVYNYGNYAFDHWSDGTTSNTKTISPTQPTTLVAYFRNVNQFPVTVNSVDLSGNPIYGLWTVVKSGSATVVTGYTPLSFSATSGTQYTISVGNYQNYVFNHWQDWSTSNSITVAPTQSSTLTAYYSTPTKVWVSVLSYSATGSELYGLWATVQSGGTIVASGYTPFAFEGVSGVPYTITAYNYGYFTFNHWSDGSTSASTTITPYQSTTIVAYY